MKENKKGNILIMLLVAVLVLGVGYFIYNSVKNSDVDLNEQSKAAAVNASSSYGSGSRSSSSNFNLGSSSSVPKLSLKLLTPTDQVVTKGDIAAFKWSTTGAESCVVTGNNFSKTIEMVNGEGVFSIGAPEGGTAYYRITCIGLDGSSTYENVTITLNRGSSSATTRPASTMRPSSSLNPSVSTSATKSMWNFWPVNLFIK